MIDLRTLLVSVVVLVAACGDADRQATTADAAAEKPKSALVVTSNYPLYFFASRITEGIDVAPEIVFPDIDGDPAFWTPGAEQIQLLQSADVVILNGAGAEPWLNLVTLDRRQLLDTTAKIADRLIPLEDSVRHQHGPEGEHSHQGTAFTTWLDPQLAIAQAQALTNAVVDLAPAAEDQFRDNMAKLERELIELDTRLAGIFAQLEDRPVLFSHPVYQYLQRRYLINGKSLHWEPDEEPTTSDWIELQQELPAHRASIMIWEDEPLQATKDRLAAADIRSAVFHPVANRPDDGDFLSVMRANAKRIQSSL